LRSTIIGIWSKQIIIGTWTKQINCFMKGTFLSKVKWCLPTVTGHLR
jgi:hypothetical protein